MQCVTSPYEKQVTQTSTNLSSYGKHIVLETAINVHDTYNYTLGTEANSQWLCTIMHKLPMVKWKSQYSDRHPLLSEKRKSVAINSVPKGGSPNLCCEVITKSCHSEWAQHRFIKFTARQKCISCKSVISQWPWEMEEVFAVADLTVEFLVHSRLSAGIDKWYYQRKCAKLIIKCYSPCLLCAQFHYECHLPVLANQTFHKLNNFVSLIFFKRQ